MESVSGDRLKHLALHVSDVRSHSPVTLLRHLSEEARNSLRSLSLKCGMGDALFPDDVSYKLAYMPNLHHLTVETTCDDALQSVLADLPTAAPKVDSLEVPGHFPALRHFLSGPSGRQIKHLMYTEGVLSLEGRLRKPNLRVLCPDLETFSAMLPLQFEDIKNLPSNLKVVRFRYSEEEPLRLFRELLADEKRFSALREVEIRVGGIMGYVPTQEFMESINTVCERRGIKFVWPNDYVGKIYDD